tara:strand:- start:577 stop:1266 length:690 start_codon:yes stop_codon:yes gene_type:complete
MKVKLESLIQGARNADGTVVVIDVFRAFTTAAVAFSQGAKRVVMVAEVEDALRLKNEDKGELCIGEVDGIKPDEFDFGNSPFEISSVDFSGKSVIQSTRAGTVGINEVRVSNKIYACSLVTAAATAKAILADKPDSITIVAMGLNGLERTDEDEICALYLRNLIRGKTPDINSIKSLILTSADAQRFDDPFLSQYDPRDREIALQIDSMSFAITVALEGDLMVAKRVDL